MNTTKKTCLIIQSGAFGDIFIVAPIAKYYYDKGYLVFWAVRNPFYPVMKYFPYVLPLRMTEKMYPLLHEDWLRSDTRHLVKLSANYDLVLNLADRGKVPMERAEETFEETKYRIANVPYAAKHLLKWKRNKAKEDQYYKDLVGNNKKYVLVHTTSSRGDKAIMPKVDYPIIEARKIKGFEIPDLYKVIINAEAIYCVESAVHQFIDGIIYALINKNIPRFLLSRPSLKEGETYTKSEYWDKKHIS